MQDLKDILNLLFSIMSIQFTVFGVKLSLMAVFFGFTLTSIVIYALLKLFN